MAGAHINVLVLGHSFSRRLRDRAFNHRCLNLNLDRTRVTVFWQGTGGATVLRPRPPHKMIWSDVHFIRDLEIDIVFIDVGSNDLSNRVPDWLTPHKLANSIKNLADECLNLGAKQVIVGELLPRRFLSTYNLRVSETNQQLELLLQNNPRIYVWLHRNNNFSFDS